ncbi:MAG: type II toxin-antitoxin system HicA family toxin [Ruminococcaceae bacterium]|nr:type II toxin-antitoxin system HicA family toxin [Oscillospiraceae bacterium]
MKSYSSREVIAMLKADGWILISTERGHHHYKHPTKKGKVTVKHPCKDIPPKTLKSIAMQSGLTALLGNPQ